ncbi:3'-5' exonuclease [Ornithobacterium rhinotracheale]|uniref:3'-5' exonuclease n=1 Tax=Ornithobacterium rhinotracheale TaxID=28251 RepID=UPI00403661DC
MIAHLNPKNILFLDIETVPQHQKWNELSPLMQSLFEQKTKYRREKEDISPEVFYESNAGIWAEFGKIICISCGVIFNENQFKTKSFFGDNERKILQDFSEMLHKHYHQKNAILCAHNGKEFDFPYIGRRLLANGLPLPEILNIMGKRPWQSQHLDTMELWKFGDYKHYTSLNLLAALLGVPTPKDDIDGSEVARVYYEEKNVERIKIYCEKDVLTVAQIFRKFRGEPLLEFNHD